MTSDIMIRDVDFFRDKEFLRNAHCSIGYESDSFAEEDFDTYRSRWIKSGQPQQFEDEIFRSVVKEKGFALVCEQGKEHVAYLWVEVREEFEKKICEVRDLFVEEAYRGRGIAKGLLEYAKVRCRKEGGNALRSFTGIKNIRSRNLHQSLGFEEVQVEYEIKL